MAFGNKKEDKDFFNQMAANAKLVGEAVERLDEVVHNLDRCQELTEKLHEVENRADGRYHELVVDLSKTFLTPIEREDIMQLAYCIDEVIDCIEDVAIRFYMLNLTHTRPEADEFLKLFKNLSEVLVKAFSELRNFKKSKALSEYLVEINRLEGEGDIIYRRSVRALYDPAGGDTVEIAKWREIYEVMETCCDKFEGSAIAISNVIMKNT